MSRDTLIAGGLFALGLAVIGGYGPQDVRELPNVEVVPNVPGQRMRDEVYARTKILLMPSEYESWGRVGLEAMCSGIPVVAHPTLGLREALGGAGLFVHRDDVAGWRAALNDLADPITYGMWASAAVQRAREVERQSLADREAFAAAVEALA